MRKGCPMNIEQAKAIALSEILTKLGFQPASRSGIDLMYLSPLRKEKKPSFHVNERNNIWYDHGSGEGGNAFDFVLAYLQSQAEDHTTHDGLRWFNNMFGQSSITPVIKSSETVIVDEQALQLKNIYQIKCPAFFNYLQSRNIPLPCASRYLKEVEIFNTKSGKTFLALGLKNEDGGYELRNKNFQGSVRSKYVSFIRGSNPNVKGIHVFEGMMDFLSALVIEKKMQFEEDVIILNSVTLLGKAYPYINNYGYENLYSWLDNDPAGDKASRALETFLARHSTISFHPMNNRYAGFQDVNAWLCASPEEKKRAKKSRTRKSATKKG